MWLCRFASELESQTWHVFFPFSHWEKDSKKQNPIHPLLTNLTSSPAQSKCAIASTCPTLRSLFVHRCGHRFLLIGYDIYYETPTTLSSEEDESFSNRNQLVFLALRSGSEFFSVFVATYSIMHPAISRTIERLPPTMNLSSPQGLP